MPRGVFAEENGSAVRFYGNRGGETSGRLPDSLIGGLGSGTGEVGARRRLHLRR